MIDQPENYKPSEGTGSLSRELECPQNSMCKVISHIDYEILFVEADREIICRYCLPFAQGFICTSARRKELYRNSHI